MEKLNDKSTDERRGFASALKHFVIFFFAQMGRPGAWVLLMAGILISEITNGFSLAGTLWMLSCLFVFFLSRITASLEEIQKKIS